jgi:integrase
MPRPRSATGTQIDLQKVRLGIFRNSAFWRKCRIRHFRHGFALNALLRWYQAGIDVQIKLPSLATYMGHVSIVSTAYYLQFVEPLAAAAGARFAKHCAALITPEPIRGDAE